jgi:ABC-2 type transport system ATP-binding protein
MTSAGAQAEHVALLDDVHRRFGNVAAVAGVSLRVPTGTILGVIGPSGAGKTTTIRLLTGALAPSAGRVEVLGEDPAHFRRRTRERIGYMPQLFSLYPDLTAGENVDFVASLFGMLFLRRRRRVREVLRLLELWDARKRRASDLSGGMQRRLELACALVHDPALLILDEPTAGIDPILRRVVWDELRRLRADGRTLLVTTQQVNDADDCDQVALIAHGRLIALADPAVLRRDAAGGDLIEVETAHAFDADVLLGRPGVRAVAQDGPRRFVVTVDRAGEFLPVVDDLVRAERGEFVAAREYRLTFDETFARLLARHGDVDERSAQADETPGRAA